MSDWGTRPLSDIVSLQRGHDLPTQTRRSGTVPVIGSFGVTGWHDEAKAPGPGVTIGRSGASIGKAVYVAQDYWPLNTCLYVTDFKDNDPRWVFHTLDLIDFTAYNSGSAQPSLNRNYLAQIPVSVPDVDEQRRISSVLGALDDLIENHRSMSSAAVGLAKATLIDAPADAQVRVGDVAEARRGLSYKGAGLADTGIPMVNMGSAANFGWLKRDGWKFYVGDYKPRHVARAGDLIITNTEQTWRQEIIGWPMLVPGDVREALFTHHTYLVDFTPEMRWMRLPLWAYLFTDEARARFNGSIRGTTVANLPIDVVENLVFPAPPEDHPSLRAAQSLLESAWADELAAADLTRTRDELRPLLMSGKVRVSENLAVA
ncbi:restriction endonuclease subunit S [Nocardioides sp. NPDC051685]|uniref:restriction endonuclease subunit S n=1 Tax=Nocardioides sp. NPDC051685 TaxID=3364334 RepID=UPI0037B83939